MMDETRVCQNCKKDFVIEPDDFLFYEKMKVPAPTFCSECRLVRRFAWRNEKSLYKRLCDKCGKGIVSVFSKETELTVYCGPCWWSDSWDGLNYGVDYDPNKLFLAQVRELFQRTPALANYTVTSTVENSDYVSMAAHLKNCYLTTYSDFNEDCLYASFILYSKGCVDNLMVDHCEFVYESVNCQKCYQTFFSVDSEGCHDVSFCRDCVGCSNCFGCSNLRNKRYHIFNEPYSKEEYEKKMRDMMPWTWANIRSMQDQSEKFWMRFPRKFMHERRNSSVSGDYIFNSKNVHDSYVCHHIENSRFCSYVTEARDCYDGTNYATGTELMYEFLQCGNDGSRIMCSWWACNGNRQAEYSMFPIGCKNVFGCVGLKKKEYCILNKQYDKESFDKLRKEIIVQMDKNPYIDKQGSIYKYGEFFPVELSPFGYNETTAQEFFPFREDEAREKGYGWKVFEKRDYKPTIQPNEIPDLIDAVQDSILQEIIACEHQGKCGEQCVGAFKIVQQELDFYRRMKLPLPLLCPNCRHHARLKWRNPATLTRRQCMCAGRHAGVYANTVTHVHGDAPCPNEFETSYAPNRQEIVYCEQCYNAEVV